MTKKVCIIGSGIAGIAALKSCIEEGHDCVCYETRDDIGGIWYYKANEDTDRSRVYESLITNVSKEASCFSDFPYPKSWTPYLSHTKVHEYMKRYVDAFSLQQYIILNTKVDNVEDQGIRTKCSRRWKVTTKNVVTSSKETVEYDAVIVCSGLNSKAKMPNYEGLSDGTFKGQVMHSCKYDTPECFQDKNVVVIGLGNSGADIAVDISRKAKRTMLSSKSGSWVVPRIWTNGLSVDMTLTTRIGSFLRNSIPGFIGDWFGRRLINSRLNHDTLGIRPRDSPLNPKSNLLINDDLPSKIVSGKLIMKPEVIKLDKDSIYFSDGTNEKVDVVICATGYNSSFSFVSNDILHDVRSEIKLYKWIFPFNIPNPSTFAVVGIVPAAGGSVFPSFECQARYVAQVIGGITKLPSVKEMEKDFQRERNTLIGQGESFRFRRKIGFYYQDQLASLSGFCPGFWQLLLSDPKLALAVYTGPFMSYHYRLVGRHQWKEARSRILNAIPNTLYAINHSLT